MAEQWRANMKRSFSREKKIPFSNNGYFSALSYCLLVTGYELNFGTLSQMWWYLHSGVDWGSDSVNELYLPIVLSVAAAATNLSNYQFRPGHRNGSITHLQRYFIDRAILEIPLACGNAAATLNAFIWTAATFVACRRKNAHDVAVNSKIGSFLDNYDEVTWYGYFNRPVDNNCLSERDDTWRI